jgi:hypothetical protein
MTKPMWVIAAEGSSRSLQVRRQAGRRVQTLCVSATTTTWLLLFLVKGGSAKL